MSGTMTQNPYIALELVHAYQRHRIEDADRRRQVRVARATRIRQRRRWSLRVVRGHRTTVATA